MSENSGVGLHIGSTVIPYLSLGHTHYMDLIYLLNTHVHCLSVVHIHVLSV